ncbi:alpha/beta fold hydrolase [Microbulbifer sp. CnH-101-G]|uniref:alpha/beta fold hydrolase n=1 Tax=Microbulbifer sp. CnH-101-G TaxID=3243393 RepID=UPI00403A2D17
MTKTFVLVHGLFHGGWCWSKVRQRLIKAGHCVYSPTQTGLGERRHLLSPRVGIDTFIDDIVNLIISEELQEITLVGHSFGGITVSAVADRLRDHIRHLVFLDAAIAQDGHCFYEQLPEQNRAQRLASSQLVKGTRCFMPISASSFDITNPNDIAWVERHLTPHPVKTYLDPVKMSKPAGTGLDCFYIVCSKPIHPSFSLSRHWAKTQERWEIKYITTGHSAPITDPGIVTDILINLA